MTKANFVQAMRSSSANLNKLINLFSVENIINHLSEFNKGTEKKDGIKKSQSKFTVSDSGNLELNLKNEDLIKEFDMVIQKLSSDKYKKNKRDE